MITLIIIFYLAAIIGGLSIGYIVYTKNTMQDRVQKEYSTRLESYERALQLKIDWEKPDYKEISRTHELKFTPKRIFAKILFSIMLVTGLILGIYINVNNGVGVSGVFIAIVELICVILLIKSLTSFKKFFFNISEKFQKEFFDENSLTAPKKAKLLTGAVFGLFAILLIAIPISAGASSTFNLNFVGIVTISTLGALLIIIALFILYGFLWILYKLIDSWIDWIKS